MATFTMTHQVTDQTTGITTTVGSYTMDLTLIVVILDECLSVMRKYNKSPSRSRFIDSFALYSQLRAKFSKPFEYPGESPVTLLNVGLRYNGPRDESNLFVGMVSARDGLRLLRDHINNNQLLEGGLPTVKGVDDLSFRWPEQAIEHLQIALERLDDIDVQMDPES